tara:strand:- start:95 stop:1201 length:1107 start_codon:yes stop_codon:yes gene_type:complete
MKVLYVGNYRDGTGWGNACANNILALDSVGVNVVPRAITFNGSKQTQSQRIAELEGQSEAGADVCIQHTLPNLYSYNAKLKNIGIFYTETLTFTETMWHKHINLLDEAWVPNSQMIAACKKSGVKIPVRLAPLSIPVENYENIADCAEVGELRGTFNFCFVGEFIRRKNMEGLLRAFHTEFHPSEPVKLFLKINKSGYTSDETLEHFDRFSTNVKENLKIRKKYQKEIAIAGNLEPRHLYSLMSKCHCFVMPSFGEAWCIPAIESMAMGIPVIYTGGTGMDDFCVGWKIPSSATPCYMGTESLSDLYTSSSRWMNPDLEALCSLMRVAYETYKNDPNRYSEISKHAKEKAMKYSSRAIGLKLKELLYE